MTDEVTEATKVIESPLKGIKETREMLQAFNELVIFFVGRFKDGVQFEDFTAFYSDIISNPETKDMMLLAFDRYDQIPAEIKDIDVYEACTLLSDQIAYIPRIVDALKKP